MNHKLMSQLAASDSTPEEIKELYHDLKFVFDSPFDIRISEAVERGCAYIDIANQLAN